MDKQELINVYEDTMKICENLPSPNSLKFSEPQRIRGIYTKDTAREGLVIVESIDTVSALIKYKTETNNVVILNNASSKRKGGGVANGSTAQEECLFRCSNLFKIRNEFYPILSNEFIYSFGATFVKDFLYNKITPIKADVITMPAINLNINHVDNSTLEDNKLNSPEYIALLDYKIDCIINSAIVAECDVLILGAWGCGVFKNNPKIIAERFKQKLFGFRGGLTVAFDKIVFAIINDKNSVDNNFEIFKGILQ